jgi:NAD(P)H-hydrate epimerase
MTSPIVIDPAHAASLLPKREAGAHKWGIGGVLIIAGAPHFIGAAWLASRAAGRAGDDEYGMLPEVAYVILPESETASGARRALDLIEAKLERMKAVVIGPGLGDDEASTALLNAVFGQHTMPGKRRDNIGFGFKLLASSDDDANEATESETSIPLFGDGSQTVVIDADALNWLSKQEEWWTQLPPGKAVLAPHIGEFSRLTGLETDEILKDPVSHAEHVAGTWKQTVVLKAGKTIVTDGAVTRIAAQESLALATAGSGDVFSGTIGALLAQGLAPIDAATVAVALGGIAAETLAAEFGDAGVIATDLPDAIARAARSLAS